ncbi:hypothetical protein LXL04_024325 [Taraxacum kok-saghyz]
MRTRALAVAEKRRKVGNGELRLPSSSLVQITKEEDARGSSASTANLGGDHVAVSCCSIDGSTEERQFTDLKVESETTARNNLDTRASKPTTEIKPGSGAPEMLTSKSSTTINCRRTVPTAELDEFFAAAEKELHKRFKDKYNYDIVSDTPSEGRFEWDQLKP